MAKTSVKKLIRDRPLLYELASSLARSTRGLARQLGAGLQSLNWLSRRRFGLLDRDLRRDYFANHEVTGLHIGCGANLLDGWLNSDYFPDTSKAIHLNAIRRFPFDGGTFDYVYSEHMIEHVTLDEGRVMLSECFRVLKPGGRVRIATPDFQFLLDLYPEPRTPRHGTYVDWIADQVAPRAPYKGAIFIINHFVRAWGHRFIYDEQSLASVLENAGFTDVAKHALQESDDVMLRGLANEDRMPEGFVELETLTLEAVKPGS